MLLPPRRNSTSTPFEGDPSHLDLYADRTHSSATPTIEPYADRSTPAAPRVVT
jgi:hypothetical protein